MKQYNILTKNYKVILIALSVMFVVLLLLLLNTINGITPTEENRKLILQEKRNDSLYILELENRIEISKKTRDSLAFIIE